MQDKSPGSALDLHPPPPHTHINRLFFLWSDFEYQTIERFNNETEDFVGSQIASY